MKTLTSKQFIEVLTKGETEGYAAERGYRDAIIIDDIEVIEDIEIKDIVCRQAIIIKSNSKFKGGIRINGGEFQRSFKIEGGEFQRRFFIIDGEFQSRFSIRGGEFQRDFLITGGEFQNVFIIEGGEFQSDFSIYGGEFQFYPVIEGGIFQRSFKIEGGEFESNFKINGGEFKRSFSIIDGKFKHDFEISGGEFQSYFTIEGGKFQREFNISDGEFKREFIISEGEFQHEFIISGGEFKRDFITIGGEFQNDFKIYGGVFSGAISIVELAEINHLKFGGRRNNELLINGIKLRKATFENLFNAGSLRIIDIQEFQENEGTHFIIKNSSMGNTEFIGWDWSSGSLTVDNSKIIDSYYTDTIFPEKILSIEEDPKQNIAHIRDTYSQLKTIADKQNDRQSSLYFQAKSNEQILELNQLILKEKAKPRFLWRLAFWEKAWWDWFQLWLGKTSNFYGTDYLRAAIMLMVVGIFSFGIYLACVNENLVFTWEIWSWFSGFWYGVSNHFGDFLGFLNPARKYNYLPCSGDHCWPQLALTIDWISRILISYFLYQLIQAFRKYGKS